MGEHRFRYYRNFWPFFLEQHSKPWTKRLHAAGTVLGTSISAWGIATRQPVWIGFGLILGYAFAWTSHFFIEKNTPATFRYPFWSFISEYRMVWWVVRGKV